MRDTHIHITGVVQGVGMRPFVYREAVAHNIAGWVLNAGDGVHVEAHAASNAVMEAFVEALSAHAPAAARIEHVDVTPLKGDGARADSDASNGVAFTIVASDASTERTTLVSPDIATCPDCLRELFDPADRRYHYPFINCTNCGPRFTIIERLPYDRPTTSMDVFPMCPACAQEYADPLDRRFHAQPDACFDCGPHITWRERADKPGTTPQVGSTREASDAIIERCAELLQAGVIVAIKGLGGFHLACDATNDTAVRELRRRKRRSNKPLAVMVAALDQARQLCHINATEEELLTGTVRPIVLLERRHASASAPTPALAPSVAFDLPELGVMLPYTPLQHLLMAACATHGIHALVMTSGNISEEPIEIDDTQAWEHLVEGGLADALLGNNRAILARYDDSVMRVVDGICMPVRRARGYAPSPLPLPKLPGPEEPEKPTMPTAEPSPTQQSDVAEPLPTILACGPEQKATFALTREQAGGTALCFVSQHIGDVEHAGTFDAWHEARMRFEELFELVPAALACDVHPHYLATQWAESQADRLNLPLVAVQHHHAHIASVIAEAAAEGVINPSEPVIGVAFDGTGAGAQGTSTDPSLPSQAAPSGEPGSAPDTNAPSGTFPEALTPDGTVWGGEVMVATLGGFTRVAHLTSWRLPGGAVSVRDARRSAFSLLLAQGLLDHPGTRTLLASLTTEEQEITRTMVERGINSPATTSMGRFLDALAALSGICSKATYEGEPAIELEACATRFCAERQGASVDTSAPASNIEASVPAQPPFVIDTKPLLQEVLDLIAAGADAGAIALTAHQRIAGAAVQTVLAVVRATGIGTVALSGGVFMNRLLLKAIRRDLEHAGLRVLVPHTVPVNDGCISYGQAAVARAQLAQRMRPRDNHQ
ncbi:MAG TPA: carbamoyltransferase HypF [Candidatus Limicola stercorigallinarum]|nr:carbamoyltransferase HypF [Candidatus Limicola stercorigallinarum]